ncbi:MAG: FtsW/RodA/SpoVE family cell cycle protein [Eubacteriales bacterium]|nr:FtsW/RodA/SpoVE family cell cycle protein [Eubacteriales bacterium]
MIKQYKLRFYNFKLVVLLLAISTIGVLLVGSAMESLKSKQLFGVICGMVILLIVSLMDFSWILNFYWFIYGFNIIMLLGIRIFGSTAGGATRWIDLGFIRFQPTELSKILLILFFAKYFMLHEKDLSELKTVGKAVGLLLIPLALIYNQPDLKNTITVVVLFCVMIYVAGLGYKIIGGVLLIAIPLVVIFLSIVVQPDQKLIKDYQRQRIMSFLYPENEEYSDDIQQQQNSITAIGSGQLTGKGLNNNEVLSANNGNFVSEIQTDFIFAVAGEELGFIGCLAIVVLLLLISVECVRSGLKSKDLSGKIICSGVGTIVAFQSFINICVATGLMPNTGTPLPFVSYGLTSLWSLFIGMGLVINVGLQQNAYSDAASKSLVHKGVERKR